MTYSAQTVSYLMAGLGAGSLSSAYSFLPFFFLWNNVF